MADTNGDEAKQVNNGADATDALLVSAGDDVPVGGGGGGPRIVAGMGAAAAATAEDDGRQPKVSRSLFCVYRSLQLK